MAPARKILLADPDPEALRALAPALRRCGYQVHGARDASRALQIAILRFPDLVLLDEASPVLEARTFMRILRTNPRTEHIPVVLTGLEPDAERSRLGTYLQKPFDVEEVLARVEQLLRRQDASRVVSGEGREIEGNLAQIPLVDLLQILTVNRKTGRLTLEREGERAAIVLREGRVIDAGAGRAGGEKALFRLLTRREGQFAFVPGHDATCMHLGGLDDDTAEAAGASPWKGGPPCTTSPCRNGPLTVCGSVAASCTCTTTWTRAGRR